MLLRNVNSSQYKFEKLVDFLETEGLDVVVCNEHTNVKVESPLTLTEAFDLGRQFGREVEKEKNEKPETLRYEREYAEILIEVIENYAEEMRITTESISWKEENGMIEFSFTPTHLHHIANIFRRYGKAICIMNGESKDINSFIEKNEVRYNENISTMKKRGLVSSENYWKGSLNTLLELKEFISK